ncbi:hypothetical protein LPJ63_001130 [Coemansia sp. RSA 2711]|nr:hypothetical protein LPJ63_001130 [Coemansia sp. RSA 2711]
MADNDELKRQIQQLERAINQRKFQRPYARFNPLRPPPRYGRPPIRASRNLKLTVQGSTPVGGDTGSDAGSGYVSYANKLVRIGSGTASLRPHTRRAPRPAKRMPVRGPRQVVIDGETFVRQGSGNKLIRASAIPPPAAAQPRQRLVSIDGENYVRTKNGSLIRVGALRVLNRRRQQPPVQKKRLCTKHLFDKCEQSASECRYSHELSPEVVPVCMHFQYDRCDRTGCPFVHVKVNPNAPICRDFVYKGRCAKGARCLHRHVLECPDWVEKGKCLKKKCRLPHPAKKETKDDRMPTKEEEELFMKQYIQRPIFDKQDEAEPASDAESDDGSADEEDLDDDVSEDEAEELLKWYDDNYVEDDQAAG